MPSGKSAIAAGLTAHFCVVFFPGIPQELSAALGIIVGLLLHWCPAALAFMSGTFVPVAAYFSPRAAAAIGHLDQIYLPTLAWILGLSALQLVISLAYDRRVHTLRVPVFWTRRAPVDATVARGANKRQPYWAVDKLAAQLVRVARPSGRSVIAAGLTAHFCVVFFPGIPQDLSAALGMILGLSLRRCPAVLAFLSATFVPAAAYFDADAAAAIGYLDQIYLPTLGWILGLSVLLLIISLAYQRSVHVLRVPVFWTQRAPVVETT
jgi:hypothetical protein